MGNRWIGSTEPSPTEGRTCSTCKEKKAAELFGKTPTGRLRGQCNPCRTHIERERYVQKRDEVLARQRADRAANPEKYSAARQARRDAINVRRAEIRKAYRAEVLAAYGPRCNCCGEAEEAFLQIDHVNNDGNLHRKIVNPQELYRWLCRNGFPVGFQVLCANCNVAKFQRGICPHRVKKASASDPSVPVEE